MVIIMKKNVLSVFAALSYLAGCLLFIYAFPSWIPALYLVSIALYAFSAGAITWLYAAKKPLMKAFICGGVYYAAFYGVTFLINNIIFKKIYNVWTTVIVVLLSGLFFVLYYSCITHRKQKHNALATCALILSALPIIVYFVGIGLPFHGEVKSVVGTSNQNPITATPREHRFDTDRLLFGVYCLPKDEKYETLRGWLKEAGIDFYVGASGEDLSKEDLDWLANNDMGVIVHNTDYYRSADHPAIWGIDLKDEPNADEFEDLAAQVKTLYAEAPDRFPMINLYPIYASVNGLGRTARGPLVFENTKIDAMNKTIIPYRMHVNDYICAVDSDIISVDIYPLQVEKDSGRLFTLKYWLRNLDILADACRATGRELWVITQAAGNTMEEGGMQRHCDTVEDQRWQNWVSLSFGAKSIIYACYYTGWWDGDSHMIDNSGSRTDTYYAVQKATEEMKTFSDVYGGYENHGAVIYNESEAAGGGTGLVEVDDAFKPQLETSDAILCGCFTEKNGNGKAFVFTNMYEPQTGKEASFSATFPGAKTITVYIDGEKTEIEGEKLDLTLASCDGAFVTVDYAS